MQTSEITLETRQNFKCCSKIELSSENHAKFNSYVLSCCNLILVALEDTGKDMFMNLILFLVSIAVFTPKIAQFYHAYFPSAVSNKAETCNLESCDNFTLE